MKINHEAIYGTTASPFKKLDFGKCTRKPGKLYLHVFKWPKNGELLVPFNGKAVGAHLLSNPGKRLDLAQKGDGLHIKVPDEAPDPVPVWWCWKFKNTRRGSIPGVNELNCPAR